VFHPEVTKLRERQTVNYRHINVDDEPELSLKLLVTSYPNLEEDKEHSNA